MATIAGRTKVRHRAAGATAGAPASALSYEINYNATDGYFYIGFGDDGSGNATSIKTFGKDDFLVGQRVPVGGSTGQVLAKKSATDLDTQWITAASYTAGSGLTLSGSQFAVDFTTVAPLASANLTGTPTSTTPATSDSSTRIATTAFTAAYTAAALAAYAPLASPAFTGTPTAPTAAVGDTSNQIATNAFVAAAIGARQQSLSPKQAVRAISTVNVSTLSGLLNIDGVTLQAGDRVLLPFQSTASQNGIYVAASGAWSRSADASTAAQIEGLYVLATNGTSYGGHGFVNTNDPDTTITVGTTALTFVEFTGATDLTAGAGISKTGNTIAVAYGAGLTLSGNSLVPDLTVIAALASPVFTGAPKAPTPATGDSTTNVATTAFVQTAITGQVFDGGTF